LLALAVAKLTFANNNAPTATPNMNRRGYRLLSVEATARVLAVPCGFDAEKAPSVGNSPREWEPIAALAIGYPGDPASLPAP